MDIVNITAIALGLSMDAFAVSIASGVAIKELRTFHALKIALFFGAFQALMPVAGWLAGLSVKDFISGFDHWAAFGLLLFVGGKMIWESFAFKKDEKKSNPLDNAVLLLLALATSIDALAVGLTFSFVNISIAFPVIIIGIVTFILSFVGVFVGKKSGHLFENRMETAGGIILIAIGFKVLLKHIRC
ncbi:MAG: manganese efflux pump MntP family protein [bacterium]